MLAAAAFNFKRMMNKRLKKFFHFFKALLFQFQMQFFHFLFYPLFSKKLKMTF